VNVLSDVSVQKGKARKENKDDERTEKIDMVNDRFFAYYKAQGIVADDEWDQFVDGLRQHLPTTFRLAGSRQCVHHPQPSCHPFISFIGPRKAFTC
jgi:hypothetical protein